MEIFERFNVENETVNVTKYSFHWECKENNQIKRWDNAMHHRQLNTYPHHMHDGNEKNVVSHYQPTLLEILDIVCIDN